MYKNYEYKILSNIQQKNIPIEYCIKFTIINTQKFEILKILIHYMLYVSHCWNYFKNMISNNIQKFVFILLFINTFQWIHWSYRKY